MDARGAGEGWPLDMAFCSQQPRASLPADTRAAAQEATAPAPAIVAPNVARQLRINIAWQIALEAQDFSPGLIDGSFKRKGLMALTEYAARFFPGASPFDIKVFQSLQVDVDGALVEYTITPDDASQVGGPIPEDWNEKAQLKRLNYESLADCITEKFHSSLGLLETLNPGIKMDELAPGQTLVVPNLRPFPEDNRIIVPKRSGADSVTVNLAEKTIRIFDKDGNELALFHCSIAKDKNKLPDHDTKVQVIAAPNPNYKFDPKIWPDVHDVTHVLIIPPGPRNPVGLAWTSLDLPGYGIHGTPKPELIGKTGSHGCFRLTNWDALKFAGYVRIDMPVKIINPDKSSETEPTH